MALLGDDRDPQQEHREHQKEQQQHQMNLSGAQQRQQMMSEDGSLRTDYVKEMVGTDLEQGTINLLSNMAAKDFVLGNLSDAEVHEIRWLTRVMRLKVESMHPNKHSIWQGEFRKVCSGDPMNALPHLNSRQRLRLEEFVQGTIARATRGKGGFQQEQFNKQISVSETRNEGDDDGDSGWF